MIPNPVAIQILENSKSSKLTNLKQRKSKLTVKKSQIKSVTSRLQIRNPYNNPSHKF